jgi:hypothetical protein
MSLQRIEQAPHDLGALELLKETLTTTAQLAEKQVLLLRTELDAVLEEERRRIIAITIGVGIALCGVCTLLSAAMLAIGFTTGHPVLYMLGLGVVLAVGAAVVLFFSFRRFIAPPSLSSSRQIMEEEIAWAKGKLAETKSSSSRET